MARTVVHFFVASVASAGIQRKSAQLYEKPCVQYTLFNGFAKLLVCGVKQNRQICLTQIVQTSI